VFETPFAPNDAHGHETGRCIILVTPDGERSMNTYLGWSEFLTPDDIFADQMAQAEWIYLEGYRFDGPASHEAFAKAIRACKGAGGQVSVTLSDPFCVERHRDAFRLMIRDDVDLLFANRAELCSMYQTEDFAAAMQAASAEVAIVACTEGEHGAHVLSGGQHWHVPAVVTHIVDATGAGDLFAGAFLWGVTNGYGLETAGRMGCIAASEVIGHIGARSESDLRALFHTHGVL
jgi:sugar/nucleoside kinase (ribokinase family)